MSSALLEDNLVGDVSCDERAAVLLADDLFTCILGSPDVKGRRVSNARRRCCQINEICSCELLFFLGQ